MPRLQEGGPDAGEDRKQGILGLTRRPRAEVVDLLATAVLQLLISGRIPAECPRTPAPRQQPAAAQGGPP